MYRKALIIGGSGLIGSFLVDFLLQSTDFDEVILFNRKPFGINNSKIREIITDFPTLKEAFPEVYCTDVFCCIGTTLADAGSQSAFETIDYEYPMLVAQNVLQQGATGFWVITATGASLHSAFFYNRTKARLEQALISCRFNSLGIVRPSLLLGKRPKRRSTELIFQWLLPKLHCLMVGKLRRLRAIHAKQVAKCLYILALTKKEGCVIVESENIGLYK
ncbi:MAG: NAD-dependent epimerase/dehydratase family protein [Bacteroidia bacterium]|nr:NAD-dependent epimerase/dehydratase family protein [Bacteroidia bacterium]